MAKYDKATLKNAYKSCTANKEELLKSDTCGCFCCCKTIPTAEIEIWWDDEGGSTGVCPRCGTDALLDAGFPIYDKEFLGAMFKLYFGVDNGDGSGSAGPNYFNIE